MTVTETILKKVKDSFQPAYLDLRDESHKHSGNRKETHFNLILSSEVFEGVTTLKRHRLVHETLKEELAGPVHALSLHLYTPKEWEEESTTPSTPDCLHRIKP